MGYVLDKETGRFVPEESLKPSSENREELVNMPDRQKDIINDGKPTIVADTGMSDEPTETFRRMSDLSVFQIVDKSTGKVMGIISGYALQIKFNLEAITETADVEQCAEGLKKLFYGIIMDQILSEKR